MARAFIVVIRIFLMTTTLAVCHITLAQTRTVEINDGRPVARAVEQLESIYGVPITYEDPIAIHESQLQDVTEQIQRTPDTSHRVIVQKSASLSFTYKLPTQPNQSSDLDAAITSVLDGYAASGGPVTFIVVKDDSAFHVIPLNFLNRRGDLEEMPPILDAKITITPKQRTAADLLSEICQSLSSSTGIKVDIGTNPTNLLRLHTTTISGSDVSARSLLGRLFGELPGPRLSWRLFYSPGWGFALNIHAITEPRFVSTMTTPR
jgi:hypothetical protein